MGFLGKILGYTIGYLYVCVKETFYALTRYTKS